MVTVNRNTVVYIKYLILIAIVVDFVSYGRVADADIIFSSCGFFFFLLSFYLFSSPYLSRHRLDVYHTSTRGVALAQI